MRTTFRVASVAMTAVAALALASCLGGGGNGEESTGEAGGEAAATEDGGGGVAAGGTAMRLAHNQTETHPTDIALKDMGTALADGTEGRWSIEVFPNATLGDQGEYI